MDSAIPTIRQASIFGFEAALDKETTPSKSTLTDETR
jgi:hypothetical protein